MHRRGSDRSLVPLYIGKAETFGRGDGNLSANLRNLRTSKDKFARWGDNYPYHIGDLSAVVLTGHPDEKQNPKITEQPQLAFDVYFWAKAWKSTDVGIWPELSPTRLAFLEYLLIGVASTAFGGSLLNYEGRNRALSYVASGRPWSGHGSLREVTISHPPGLISRPSLVRKPVGEGGAIGGANMRLVEIKTPSRHLRELEIAGVGPMDADLGDRHHR
jgi:hypothetical protein